MCVEFRDEILLKGEECKTREKLIFLRNGKMVILIKKIQNFFISQMTKRISPLKSSLEI